jgi:hypothetical protein
LIAEASWVPVIASTLGVMGALVGVGATIRHNARTNRANLFSTYRLKWIDLFRDELAELLILGEQLYGYPLNAEKQAEDSTRQDLRARAMRLIVLLGREDRLRLNFAELKAFRRLTLATALRASRSRGTESF